MPSSTDSLVYRKLLTPPRSDRKLRLWVQFISLGEFSRARAFRAHTLIHMTSKTWIYACEYEVAPRYATRGPYASVGRQGPRGTVSRYCKPVLLSNQIDSAWTDPRFLISYFCAGKKDVLPKIFNCRIKYTVIMKRYLILILFNRAYKISYFYNFNFIKDWYEMDLLKLF